MKIVRLSDEQRLRELYAFRYRIYVQELRWLDPCCSPEGECFDDSAFERGELTDRFDSEALNYAAYDEDGQIVGSMRTVFDGPNGLPLEDCWHLDGFRHDKRIAELCRLAVTPERRLTRLPLLLMKAGYQGARRQGVTHVLVDAYVDDGQRTHTVYKRLGFVSLGDTFQDSRYVLSAPSLVMAIECESGEEALPAHLREFFRTSDPSIHHDG